MAQNTKKTINFTLLEILRSMAIPFNVMSFSTLNEKYQLGNITPPNTGYPTLKYLAIGRGGHRNVIGGNSSGLVDILEHSVTDSTLFEQIPFVLVPITDDISNLERAKYRIRKLETHNGVQYFAYYLKVIPENSITPEIRVIELSNGVKVSDVPYVASASSLAPTPVDLSNTVVNTVEGRHIVVQSKINIQLDPADIVAINDAVTTIYGDVRYSTISELGIVSAYDVNISSTLGGVNVSYDEVRSAQIMCFIGTQIPLQHYPELVDVTYGLSNTSPLPPTSI